MRIDFKYMLRLLYETAIISGLSIFFVFLIIAPLLKNGSFLSFWQSSAIASWGVSSLLATLLLLAIPEVNLYWQRYRNTKQINAEQPFLIIDKITLFILFSLVFVLALAKPGYPTSYEYFFRTNLRLSIAVDCLMVIIWLGLTFYIKPKEKKLEVKPNDAKDISDEPIRTETDDLLERTTFVEGLAKEIAILPRQRDSFVFGLYGAWGEGKTSVLNLLEERLASDKDIVIVRFDPWYFNNDEAVLNAFYGEIEKEINKTYVFPNLRKSLSAYQDLIKFGVKKIGFDFTLREETIEEVKHRIEKYIIEMDKKILIFIDNVDRLESNEVKYIFKLVKLNSNFKNTVFMLSLDTSITKEKVGDLEYLAKIVQKPITLPPAESSFLDEYLSSRLDVIIEEAKMPLSSNRRYKEEFSYFYQIKISKFFKNLRDIKRFLNSLETSYLPVATEVDFSDFFTLEIIKIFRPRIYDDIWKNAWAYIPLRSSDKYFFMSPFTYGDDNEKYQAIKSHVDGLFSSEDEKKEKDEILPILTELFFEVKNAFTGGGKTQENLASLRQNQRLSHPDCFPKYFILKNPKGELSDDFIRQFIKEVNEVKPNLRLRIIKKILKEVSKSGLMLECMKKLHIFIGDFSKDSAECLSGYLSFSISSFSRKGTENFWNSEYDKAVNLILSLVEEKIPDEEIQGLITKLIKNTPNLELAAHLIYKCDEKRNFGVVKIYKNTKLEELKRTLDKRLGKYLIKEKRNIFDEYSVGDIVFILAQWSNYFSGNKSIVTNYFMKAISLEKFIEFLLAYQDHRGFRDESEIVISADLISKNYYLHPLLRKARQFLVLKDLKKEQKECLELFIGSAEEVIAMSK